MTQSDSENKKKESEQEVWKTQVKKYFADRIALTEEQKSRLENVLLTAKNTKTSSSKKVFSSFLKKHVSRLFQYKQVIFSHCITVAVTMLLSVGILSFYYEKIRTHSDFISELALLPETDAMPADFDLVGDADALPEMSKESLESNEFQPVIPKQIAQSYAAYQGRFFQLKGSQGVSIAMEPNHDINHLQSSSSSQKSFTPKTTLYIVKLSAKDESSFPKEKIIRKIQASVGKIKRIYAWRDGAYGYAMVGEQEATTDGIGNDETVPFESALHK